MFYGKESIVLNFSDVNVKRQYMAHIGTLSGLYEVKLKPRKRTRSNDQNAYYWIAVCVPLSHWLTEQSGQAFTKDDAHEFLKSRFCSGETKEFVNKETGEVVEVARKTTTKLDAAEFSEYIERCCEWMADFCGIAVIPSQMFYEQTA